jgi:hypothetical protein
MGERTDGGQVDELERRVARRFQEHEVRPAAERAFPCVDVLAVDQLDVDVEPRTELGQDPVAGAEEEGGAHDPHPRLELAHQGRMHRGHAAGRGRAVLRALEQRRALLKHPDRRVAHPRVGVAVLRLGETSLGVLSSLVAKARGEEEGFGGFAVGRAIGPSMHEPGLWTPIG